MDRKSASKIAEHFLKNGTLIVFAAGIVSPVIQGVHHPSLYLGSGLAILLMVTLASWARHNAKGEGVFENDL